MPELTENEKMNIHLRHSPNPGDLIDGKSYSWWMEQISNLNKVYFSTLKDPECLERYNKTVTHLKKCLEMVILLRWVLASPDRADKIPPNIPQLDPSIFSNPKVCVKCGTPHVPLYDFIPNLPRCCYYCGSGLLAKISIMQGDEIIDTVENYCLPHPRDFVDDDDSVFIQASGELSLSKVKGTYAEKYVQEGYRLGQKLGIALKTDHEAAVLHLLSTQVKEIRQISGQMPKNEYIVRNQQDIVVECKQIQAFEKGRIKENPRNPNTMKNCLDTALRQHSQSAEAELPLLLMVWIKFQNRIPLFRQDEYLKEYTEGLPNRTFLIISTGILTDINFCEIYTNKTKDWVKADQIIPLIEANLTSH